jgi:hypothetical protein
VHAHAVSKPLGCQSDVDPQADPPHARPGSPVTSSRTGSTPPTTTASRSTRWHACCCSTVYGSRRSAASTSTSSPKSAGITLSASTARATRTRSFVTCRTSSDTGTPRPRCRQEIRHTSASTATPPTPSTEHRQIRVEDPGVVATTGFNAPSSSAGRVSGAGRWNRETTSVGVMVTSSRRGEPRVGPTGIRGSHCPQSRVGAIPGGPTAHRGG